MGPQVDNRMKAKQLRWGHNQVSWGIASRPSLISPPTQQLCNACTRSPEAELLTEQRLENIDLISTLIEELMT